MSEEQTRWLIYWGIYGLWSAFESVFGFALRLLPLYSILKIVVFFALMSPEIDGAMILYRSILEGYMRRNRRDAIETFEEIDNAIRELPADVMSLIKNQG